MVFRAHDNLHSRVVAVLKIALPLLALAILSSLFLFSRQINPEDAIPYAKVDIEDRLREPRLTDAGLSGVTNDGAALTLNMAEARPRPDGSGTATGITGRLATPDGATTDITAGSATVDNAAKSAALSGGVTLKSSAGYTVLSSGFDLALDRTSAVSQGAVTADAPMGKLTADQMKLDQKGPGQGYLLVFNGNVRLLYQPAK